MFTNAALEFTYVDEEALALNQMEKLLRYLDPQHPLLAAILNVKGMVIEDQ
jgi:hypothetical protein